MLSTGVIQVKGVKQAALAVGAIVLLAGCAAQPQYRYAKEGATQQSFSQDDAACAVQTQTIQVADWEYQGTIMEGANINMKRQKTHTLCMISKGYQQVQ